MPLLVQETLQARLDRLQPTTREVGQRRVGHRRDVRPAAARAAHRRRRSSCPRPVGAAAARPRRRGAATARARVPLPPRPGPGGRIRLADGGRRRRSCTAPPGRLSRSCAPTRSRRCTSRSRATSARRASPRRPSNTSSPRATPPGRSTPTGLRSRTTGGRSTFMETDDPRGRDLLCKIALAHHLDFDFAAADAAWREAPLARPLPAATHRPRPSVWSRPRRTFSRFLPGIHVRHAGLVAHGGPLLRPAATRARAQSRPRRCRGAPRFGGRTSLPARVCGRTPPGPTASRSRRATSSTRGARSADSTSRQHIFSRTWQRPTRSNELTLEIRLRAPRPYFPYLLAMPASFPWPAHVCERRRRSTGASRHTSSRTARFCLVEQDEKHALAPRKPALANPPVATSARSTSSSSRRPSSTAASARHELDLRIGGPRLPDPVDGTLRGAAPRRW